MTNKSYSDDYEQGPSDGGEYNARHNPGNRSGKALDDYNRGFKDGENSLAGYIEAQTIDEEKKIIAYMEAQTIDEEKKIIAYMEAQTIDEEIKLFARIWSPDDPEYPASPDESNATA
jgi:hypothetical protein